MDSENTFSPKKQPYRQSQKVVMYRSSFYLTEVTSVFVALSSFILSTVSGYLVVGTGAEWFQNHGNSKNKQEQILGLYSLMGSLLIYLPCNYLHLLRWVLSTLRTRSFREKEAGATTSRWELRLKSLPWLHSCCSAVITSPYVIINALCN